MSEKTFILLEDISSYQVDTESIVRAAASPSSFDAPEDKVAGEKGEESPVAGPEGPIKKCGVCEKIISTEEDVEDEDVDVVGSVYEVGVPGYESEGFTLSENLRRKRTAKKSVSEGLFDTAHRPQCEFSLPVFIFLFFTRNLHSLPVIFL